MKYIVFITILLTSQAAWSIVARPFGSPGITPNWSKAKKVQVGTSFNTTKSLVWFTNTEGVLTETYYPTIDKAQIKDAQFLVTDGKSFFVEEKNDLNHQVKVEHPSLATLSNTDTSSRFEISHTFFTLDNSSVLVDEVTFKANEDGLSLYLLVNPHLNNTGFGDSGFVTKNGVRFEEDGMKLWVSTTAGVDKSSLGYVGFSDGWQDLHRDFQMNYSYSAAKDGNIASTMKLALPAKKGEYKFYVVYNFENAATFSPKFLAGQKEAYTKGWDSYFNGLKNPGLTGRELTFYQRSLYVLRVHEDKLNPGAMIASLSKPWGDKLFEHPGVFTGGYHLVWPRDLFHVSLALLNAGDRDTALRALRFLKRIQYKEGEWNFNNERVIQKRGAFPQNVWMDGSEYWGGLQLDQVGYPVQLFYHLYKTASKEEKKQLMSEFKEMLDLALDFIVTYGPWSAQERWEENFGISPSTFSVATAALKMASEFTGISKYKTIAEGWLTKPGDNIHSWTFTSNGHYGDGSYYIRVGGCANYLASWDPNSGQVCTVANSGQRVEQTKMLDQGFLKLSLMGLVSANDWRILTSLEKVNKHVRKSWGKFSAWYRYSFDAYGEDEKGRLWPLLSSEHGRFAIERYRQGGVDYEQTEKKVQTILESYKKFANAGLMIPEQVFEDSFEGTGAATPLAWSHAEYIKLLWSWKKKKNVENVFTE